jgi:uncharacterized protein (TIGR03067 family)
MHGGLVDKNQRTLPARPNLDHLRGQAKQLLALLKKGDAAAARAFAEHLPGARGASPRAADVKLADAQSVVARQSGFASWAQLARHVDALRALEGEWRFTSLAIEGNDVPAAAIARSRILMDGDRFRTESDEATYEGVFTIDADAEPARIDIAFVAGPEAGKTAYGIFAHDGDELILCLGLVGSARPSDFASTPGSGCALERLHRASRARPANVDGGTPPAPQPPVERVDPAAFDDAPRSSMLDRLQGEWSAVELVRDGKALPEQFLAHGKRSMTGNEVMVVFGGQTMVHAKVRIDDSATPIAIDYVGVRTGEIARGILEWIGDDVRFCMAPAGAPRPASFADLPASGTTSRWRRKPR